MADPFHGLGFVSILNAYKNQASLAFVVVGRKKGGLVAPPADFHLFFSSEANPLQLCVPDVCRLPDCLNNLGHTMLAQAITDELKNGLPQGQINIPDSKVSPVIGIVRARGWSGVEWQHGNSAVFANLHELLPFNPKDPPGGLALIFNLVAYVVCNGLCDVICEVAAVDSVRLEVVSGLHQNWFLQSDVNDRLFNLGRRLVWRRHANTCWKSWQTKVGKKQLNKQRQPKRHQALHEVYGRRL